MSWVLLLCQLPGVPDARLAVAQSSLFVGAEARGELAFRSGQSLVTGAGRGFDDGQAKNVLKYLPPHTAEIRGAAVRLGGLMS